MSQIVNIHMEEIVLLHQLQKLYDEYALALDQDNLDIWLSCFSEQCVYRIISRENFELNMPIAVWHSDSKAMLRDRVLALRDSTLYRPRYFRHLLSGLKIEKNIEGVIHAQANVIIAETVVDYKTQILLSGRYLDQIVIEDDVYKFKNRVCVYDSILLPTSLVYPV
jgi:3-phenylpropionate/cinnamic acid dioxygenase small subunit